MRRSLGLFDVICIGLNAIVGSGIFLLPDDLYRDMGGLSPLAFLFCAIGLLPIALCYAEAASRVDRTGGPYLYTSEAFGPLRRLRGRLDVLCQRGVLVRGRGARRSRSPRRAAAGRGGTRTRSR